MMLVLQTSYGKFMGKPPEEEVEFQVPMFALEFVVGMAAGGMCQNFDDSCRIAEKFTAPLEQIHWTRSATPKELDSYLEFLKDSLPIPE